MQLRKLKLEDAPYIYEWMKDPELNCFFQFDPDKVSIQSIESFIESAQDQSENCHYAVADDTDEYMGTISLKHIDHKNHHAEYAVSMRKCAIGTGLAKQASQKLLEIAFGELALHKVYLNVYSDNLRAIRLYEKLGFRFEGIFKEHVYGNGHYRDLSWYGIFAPAQKKG